MPPLLYRGARRTPRRLRRDGVWVLDRHYCKRPTKSGRAVGDQVGCKCGKTWWTLRLAERFGVYLEKGAST